MELYRKIDGVPTLHHKELRVIKLRGVANGEIGVQVIYYIPYIFTSIAFPQMVNESYKCSIQDDCNLSMGIIMCVRPNLSAL